MALVAAFGYWFLFPVALLLDLPVLCVAYWAAAELQHFGFMVSTLT